MIKRLWSKLRQHDVIVAKDAIIAAEVKRGNEQAAHWNREQARLTREVSEAKEQASHARAQVTMKLADIASGNYEVMVQNAPRVQIALPMERVTYFKPFAPAAFAHVQTVDVEMRQMGIHFTFGLASSAWVPEQVAAAVINELRTACRKLEMAIHKDIVEGTRP